MSLPWWFKVVVYNQKICLQTCSVIVFILVWIFLYLPGEQNMSIHINITFIPVFIFIYIAIFTELQIYSGHTLIAKSKKTLYVVKISGQVDWGKVPNGIRTLYISDICVKKSFQWRFSAHAPAATAYFFVLYGFIWFQTIIVYCLEPG